MNALLAIFCCLLAGFGGQRSLARTRRGGDSRRNTTLGQRPATPYRDRKRIWVLVGATALQMPVLRQTYLQPPCSSKTVLVNPPHIERLALCRDISAILPSKYVAFASLARQAFSGQYEPLMPVGAGLCVKLRPREGPGLGADLWCFSQSITSIIT